MSNIKKFFSLYLTNFFGVVNDNFLKTLAALIAVSWVSDDSHFIIVNVTAAALVLPYLFFSPLAGKLPHYFNKVKVVRVAKLVEFPIMILAILGFYFQNIYITITSVLLMGLQSALYSPAKYSLIKDIGGENGISEGMGGMEAVAFLAMLIGTVVAAFMSDYAQPYIFYLTLLGLAILGYIFSLFIKSKNYTIDEVDSSINPITFIKDSSKIVAKYSGLNSVIHILCLFWWLCATLQTLLLTYCPDILGMSKSNTGCVLAIMAIGVSLGCVICGKLDKKFFMLGKVYIWGIIIAILLLCIFIFDQNPIGFTILVTLISFLGGFFKIPLDAEIQKRVDSKELNVILAYFNLISFVYIFIAAVTNILIIYFWGPNYVFLILAIVFGLFSFIFTFNYRSVVANFAYSKMKLHYKVNFFNKEILEISPEQNILLLPTHRAVIDPLLLLGSLYNYNIQPLVDERFFKIPFINGILKQFKAVQVPDLRKSRAGVEQALQLDSIVSSQLNKGGNILFYPSGHVTTDGKETIGARRLAYDICKKLPKNTKVVALKIDGLWGSKWSRYGLNATPNIVNLLLKSMILIYSGAIFFKKKRNVDFYFYDVTDLVKQWSLENKMDFNKKFEEFFSYGPDGEIPILT
ncbi:MAG: MFS transporter [Bacteroidales bacterium]|nr:MFS transporter [Bacteroidales bacterium]